MLLFDIGANRGDATLAGLEMGYEVVALEPAPRIFAELIKNFVYNPRVKPLKYAVAESDYATINFYECVEDGLSTTNLDWLTKDTMPYAGKPYRTVVATTITIDTLADKYGAPDLIKIDVEGGEWPALLGMKRKYGEVAIEWTFETLDQHEKQMDYLYTLGYREYAPQFIEKHLQRPAQWFDLRSDNEGVLWEWHKASHEEWITGGWKVSNLRPTADVGMLWIRG